MRERDSFIVQGKVRLVPGAKQEEFTRRRSNRIGFVVVVVIGVSVGAHLIWTIEGGVFQTEVVRQGRGEKPGRFTEEENYQDCQSPFHTGVERCENRSWTTSQVPSGSKAGDRVTLGELH